MFNDQIPALLMVWQSIGNYENKGQKYPIDN